MSGPYQGRSAPVRGAPSRPRHHLFPAAFTLGVAAAFAGCDARREEDRAAPEAPAPPRFADVAEASGLRFVHTTGATGRYHFPEIAGSGCGFFDYDGDGDLDVYAIQALDLDAPAVPGAGGNRLFRNDLRIAPDGRPELRFTDVTAEAGVGHRGYGMGLAVGDYDGDGDPDLYVSNFGPDVLYRNEGDGTFRDVTAEAFPGGAEPDWSTSCAFLDHDRDGDLDLYVARYVNFSLRDSKLCRSPSGRRDYCGPQSFDPVPDRLYRNEGDGTFRDVSAAAGLETAYGSGLGVVCADFDRDGLIDVYVANDGNANQLWMNRGDGTFRDTALEAGAAYNAAGQAEAGMGVTAADFDLDGDEDVFLTHLIGEHNTLLVNDGTGSFDDRTGEHGLAAPSWRYTGFGTLWSDLDNDGDLDLFVANGGVKIVEEVAGEPYPYGNPNQLFLNRGPPRFDYSDRSREAGAVFDLVETSRGAAFGDVDNDGDVDILVSHSNGPLRLLRNESGAERSWLIVRLAAAGGRSEQGAYVRLVRDGRPDLLRRAATDGSYLSANDPRMHFGLGEDEGQQAVVVTWPGGRVERFAGLAARTVHVLNEGTGAPDAGPAPVAAAPSAREPGGEAGAEAGTQVGDVPAGGLPPVPAFPFESMEPAVRLQFESARRRLEGDSLDPAANGELGMLFHAYGFHALAEPCYRRAVAFDPRSARFRSLLARALAARGAWDEASAEFARAEALGGADAASILQRADADRQAGRLDDALRGYERVQERWPRVAAAWCGAGRVYLQRGDAERARRNLARALDLAPEYSTARYALGQALRRLGRAEEALVELRLAEAQRDREPDLGDPVMAEVAALRRGADDALHRAIDLLRDGRVPEATALLEEAVRIDPELVEAHSQLGAARLLAGDLDRAAESLERALALEPGYVDALYNLGLVAHRRGDDARAVDLFSHAAEVRPRHFEAQRGLGTALHRMGRSAEAVAPLSAALELRPGDPRPYKDLAAVLGALGRHAEAIRALRQGVERLPGDASIADRLARELATCPDESQRDPQEALLIAEQVCRRTGDSVPQAIETRAVALAALGRFAEAVRALDEALASARRQGKEDLAAGLESRLERYRRGEP